MEVTTTGAAMAEVRLTNIDILLIANSLNEVLNGIEVGEFHARLGGTREEVEVLRKSVAALLDKLERF